MEVSNLKNTSSQGIVSPIWWLEGRRPPHSVSKPPGEEGSNGNGKASNNHFRRFIDDNYTNYKTRRWRIFSGGRSGGSRWDWDGDSSPNRRSRFGDAYATEEVVEEGGFGFRNAAKQRVWWSDDVDAEEDAEDDGFGIIEASIGFDWALKIFQAFGWMIPAVMVSLLMGTGPDAAIMALALPLAQSAFSLAADTLWGRPDGTPKPKSKRKKRPFNGSRVRARARREKEMQAQKRKEAVNYKSWFEGSNSSAKDSNRQDFEGWDEVDNPLKTDRGPRVATFKEEEAPRAKETFKRIRRTKGETPLLIRLLIAMFPFLGFWTTLF